jgi:hypothetical protein
VRQERLVRPFAESRIAFQTHRGLTQSPEKINMARIAALWRRAHAAALVVAMLPAVLVAVLKALVMALPAVPLPIAGGGERARRQRPQRRGRSPERHEPHAGCPRAGGRAGSPGEDAEPFDPAESSPSNHRMPNETLPTVADVGALAYVVDGVRTYPV